MTIRLKATILVMAIAICGAQVVMSTPISLPGSQPLSGRTIDKPSGCGCHKNYNQAVEPMFNWQGSMMSQAMRDPLFLAALDIANYDLTDAGDLCLRCHTPQGWLGGRSEPTDGSLLNADDMEGVVCDFCHALIDPKSAEANALVEPDVPAYGNGMFVITSGNEKRGPFDDATAPHQWQFSAFHRSGNLCGVCHDVSNPTNCPTGNSGDVQECFPIERTYSEWNNSIYSSMGESGNCQSCHMVSRTGKACKQGGQRIFLPVHELTGGNAWLPDAIAYLYPSDPDVNIAALAAGKQRAIDLLQSAAFLEAFDITDQDLGNIQLKITNYSGHKLPTGYPEGRRMWLNIIGYDAGDQVVFESGAYDDVTAVLDHDAQVKVYEVKPGMLTGEVCNASFHFVLNNCIESDNRIPPEGFTNANFEAVRAQPVNYPYADLQYWDFTEYQLPQTAVRFDANLYYQSTSKEYVEFLSSAPGSGTRGQELLTVWNATGKSTPVLMASTSLTIDADLDGMGDAWETANSLNPGDPADANGDFDIDGLTNLNEYLLGTFANVDDSDLDGMPDGWEFNNGLDPTVDDSALDPDNDGNTNIEEYLAGTDPQAIDVACEPGLFCYGDQNGDGVPTLAEVVAARDEASLVNVNYSQVYPSNGDTLDLNGDTFVSLSDVIIMRDWTQLKENASAAPATPAAVTILSPAGGTVVPIGATVDVFVEVRGAGGMLRPGVGVVFEVLSGTATLTGGFGDASLLIDPDTGTNYPAGSTWGITGTVISGSQATVTLRRDAAGVIQLRARVPKSVNKQLPVGISSTLTLN